MKWFVSCLLLIMIASVTLGFNAIPEENFFQTQDGDEWDVFVEFDNDENYFNEYFDSNGLGQAQLGHGGLEVSTFATDLYNWVPFNYASPKNIFALVDVEFVSGDPSTGAGLICDYDYDTEEGIYFEASLDGYFTIYMRYGDEYYFLSDIDTTNPTWNQESIEFVATNLLDLNKTNELGVYCNQGSYKFGINEVTVAEFTSPYKQTGEGISLFTYTYSDEGGTIRFDDFYAESLDTNPNQTNIPQKTNKWSISSKFDSNDGLFLEDTYKASRTRYANLGFEFSLFDENKMTWAASTIDAPSNVSVEADVLLVDGDLETGAGISCDAFTMNDALIPFGTFFVVTFDGYYTIVQNYQSGTAYYVNDGWIYENESGNKYVQTDLIDPYEENHIKMNCDHGNYQFYINQVLVAQYEAMETDMDTNIVLFAQTYQNPNSIVRFDNFYAESLEYTETTSQSSSSVKQSNSTASTASEDDYWYILSDFSEKTVFSEYYKAEMAEAVYNNGGFDISLFNQNLHFWSSPNVPTPTDIGIEIEATLIEGGLETIAGMACEYSYAPEFPTHPYAYGVFFEITFDGYFAIYKNTQAGFSYYSNGEWEYISGEIQGIPDLYQQTNLIDSYGTNRLMVMCDHGDYQFYINDVLAAKIADYETSEVLDIAIYSSSYYVPSSTVRFDNFYAVALDDLR